MSEEVNIDTKVRKLREDHLGFSQSELADQLNVSENTVSRWENGQTEPSRLHRRLLAAIAVRDDVPEEFVEDFSTTEGEPQEDSEVLSSVFSASVGAAAGGALAGPIGAVVGSLASSSIMSGGDEAESDDSLSPPVKRLKERVGRCAENLDVSRREFREELLSVFEVASAVDWDLDTLLSALYALSATADGDREKD